MEKFQELIDSIKRQLNFDDPKSYNHASFYLLNSLRENEEEEFINELINSDVMIDIIQIINPENQRCLYNLLECLKIITERSTFLKNDFVDETIKNISKCDFIDFEDEATVAVNILLLMVEKVFKFDESQGISLIQQHADELLNFICQPTFDLNSLLSTTKLLNFIIRYSATNFQQKNFSDIRELFSKSIKCLIKSEADSVLERMRSLCCISTSVVKLCYEIDEIDPEDKKTLLNKIKLTAIEEVFPLLQSLQFDIKTAEDFIDFLESVINLRDYKDNDEVCYHLMRNSYLTYLLALSVFEPERHCFRMKVCRVISKIIVTLNEIKIEFPLYDWPGGSSAFQNFLCTGLGSLPVVLNQWENLLNTHDQKSNSLLVLVYCHFIATHEKYIFTRKSLAIRLTNVRESSEPIFLKALWLLYSVSSLTPQISNSPVNPRLYSKATRNLANTLQKQSSIEFYYTHHKDLLIYSIKEIKIPEGLRIKVVRLWIDKSNSEEEFDAFVEECLDQGYNELKIVKILMGLVHENCMININKTVKAYAALLKFREVIPENVVELVLKTLAEDFANYTPSDSNILKIVLRFACTLPISKSLSSTIVRKCVVGIGKIVIREDTDLILKTLLITAGAFAIRQSIVLNDSKVTEIFLKNDEFLKEIYDSGFFSKTLTMTEVCIRTLTCLIFCQHKFQLQCKSVSQVTFRDLEKFLVKMQKEKSSPILGVELIKLLLLTSTINNPLIVLHRLEQNKDLDHIFNIYFLIHTIHDEAIPGEEGETYQCLSTMLDYCYAQKLNINVFLSCAATPVLVEIAIERISKAKQLSLAFLHFSITWLRYRHDFRKNTGMKIKSFVEETASLLIEFQTDVTKMDSANSNLVQDFCATVDNYIRDY